MLRSHRRRFALQAMTLIAVCLVGGCDRSDYPRTLRASKPAQFQEQAADVQDWDRAAGRLAKAMDGRGYFAVVLNPGDQRKFFVHSTRPDSQFLTELGRALQSEIIKRGGTVSPDPNGAFSVDLDVDLINWVGDMPGSTVIEASWDAVIMVQGSVDFHYRDQFYVRVGDIGLYDSALMVQPLYAPVKPVRLVQ